MGKPTILLFYRATRELGRCRSCHAEVEWVVLTSGHRHPLNRGAVATYDHELLDGKVVDRVSTEHHASHFETCPDAAKWKRRR